ncbi:MAG: hypothetical protein R3B93_24695 [Bacteroidia bacterium]
MLYANKSYKELAKDLPDNGMNNFLDILDSSKGNPNENFCAGFLELFTIEKGPGAGPGDYTTYRTRCDRSSQINDRISD